MKKVFKIFVVTSILSLAFIGCNESSSDKSNSTNENQSLTISRGEHADFSSAKTSADSLRIIKKNLKSTGAEGDCCCKYYNMGSYHYESTSKGSCDYVGGTCVDASNCR